MGPAGEHPAQDGVARRERLGLGPHDLVEHRDRVGQPRGRVDDGEGAIERLVVVAGHLGDDVGRMAGPDLAADQDRAREGVVTEAFADAVDRGIDILKFADVQWFQTTAANKVTLAGGVQTYEVANSELVQGTNAAEHFIIESHTSADVLVGAGDVVDLSHTIGTYSFKQSGTALQISDGTFTTTLNVGGAFTLRASDGSTSVAIDLAGGGVIKPFLEHTPETLHTTIDRNLWTVLWASRVVLPVMLRQGATGRVLKELVSQSTDELDNDHARKTGH